MLAFVLRSLQGETDPRVVAVANAGIDDNASDLERDALAYCIGRAVSPACANAEHALLMRILKTYEAEQLQKLVRRCHEIRNRYHVAKRVTCGAREAQRTELSNQLKRVSFARRLGSIGPAWLDACKSVPPVLNIPDVTLRDYDDRPLACYENTNPLAVWRLYATGEGRTLWCWLPTTGSSYAWSLKGV